MGPIIAALALVVTALIIGLVVASGTVPNTLAITLGLIMFILAVVRTDLALYFLILSMLLSPEISLGGIEEKGVSGGRSVVIRLDDLFLMLIAFGWLARSAIFKEIGLVLKSPINGAIYAYTAIFIIATGAGMLYEDVEPFLGIFNCIKFIQYFILFFMVLNNIESEKHAKRLINVAIFTAFIIAIYAISQIPSGERVTAPFEGKGGEPNTLGGYMLFMLSITLALFLESRNFYRSVFFAFMSILSIIALFYTESRSSYIGLLFSFIALSFFARKRNFLFVGIIITLIFSSLMLPDRVIERINLTFQSEVETNPFEQEDELEKIDSSTAARLRSWGEAITGWKKYPILGWGVTGFMFIDAQYLKVLVETGTLGILTFIILLSAIYRNLKKTYLAVRGIDDYYQGIALGTFAGFVGLCGHAIGTNTFIIIRIMEPFWLFMGIVVSIPYFLPAVAEKMKIPQAQLKVEKTAEPGRVSFFT